MDRKYKIDYFLEVLEQLLEVLAMLEVLPVLQPPPPLYNQRRLLLTLKFQSIFLDKAKGKTIIGAWPFLFFLSFTAILTNRGMYTCT